MRNIKTDSEVKGVQSLERALDLIEILSTAREGLGVTQMGELLGLHKSTVHRLVNALASRGYVEKDNERATYRLGLHFIEIASQKLNQIELKTEAAPILRKLAMQVGQPVHLAILHGSDAVYIEKIEPIANLRLYSQIGKRIPVYCSALGKALITEKSAEEITELMKNVRWERYTAKTLQGTESLLKEMETSRQRGYSIDDEEHDDGIRCIAAPIRDYTGKIIASVSVAGDSRILSPAKDREHGNAILETAAAISARLGYTEHHGRSNGTRRVE